MPVFNPGPWNDPTAIQLNNCYNYALDRMDNVRRDPGELAGAPVLSAFNQFGWAVAQAAVSDGLMVIPAPLPLQSQTTDYWVAALVTAPPFFGAPDGDYHWYRRDDTGMWSHKSGFGADASDLDDDGNAIADPVSCSRGQYCYFFGYFIVDRKRLKP